MTPGERKEVTEKVFLEICERARSGQYVNYDLVCQDFGIPLTVASGVRKALLREGLIKQEASGVVKLTDFGREECG